jgi:sodium/hydrogen antiporter
MLLNISVFMWYGAVCPWASFRVNNVIPIWRLILLGILILLLRRIPFVMAIHKKIPQIEEVHQAGFMGFFGPIGVSAIFYLYVSLDFLSAVTDQNSDVRPDAQRLKEIMNIVVWFLAICSIVVHGLSVPMGKLGYNLPRQISQALSTSQEVDEPYQVSGLRRFPQNQPPQLRQRRNPNTRPDASVFSLGPPRARKESNALGPESPKDEPERPIFYPETPIDGARTPNDPLNRSQSPLARASGELRSAGPSSVPSASAQKEL